MSVWNGWQADLLSHAGIPNTAGNRKFLSDWHAHAETNCRDNPIDLSVRSAGASNCHALPGINARAQNYSTTGNAVHAFDVQIHQNAYRHLLSAMLTGNPYTASGSGLAGQDLTAWGSQGFAQFYFNATAAAPGRSGGYKPTSTKAWSSVQRSVNHGLPTMLRRTGALNKSTSQLLRRKRRVRH